MAQRKWNRFGLLASLLVIALVCYYRIDWRWRERPDPSTGVALELRPAYQVIKADRHPFRLGNRGREV